MVVFFFCFTTKNDFLSLFSRVWVQIHFPLKSSVWYPFQILLRSFEEVWQSWITEIKDASSAANLTLVESPSERSFIKIKNNNGPRIEPSSTPAVTFVHAETWPLWTTRCLVSRKKSFKSLSKFLHIPF